MKITCSICNAEYQLKADKAPAAEVRTRCPSCGGAIVVPAAPTFPSAAGSRPTGSDFGRTMAFDFSSVDQSATQVSDILRQAAEAVASFSAGFRYLLRDPSSGKRYPLTKPVVLIGRSGADVILTDPEVSRRHCLLNVYGETAVLTDQESTNGTFYDGRKVLTARLRSGESFVVGNTTLQFLLEADA